MRLGLLALLVLAGLSIGAASASADTANSAYFSLHGGLNLVHDEDLQDNFAVFGLKTVAAARYEPGYTVGGTLGYKATNFLRVELEATYRRNALDEIEWDDAEFKVGHFRTKGHISSLAIMSNLFFEFPTQGRLVPSVGFGFGLATVFLEDTGDSDGPLFDEKLVGPAFQAGVGLGYAFNDSLMLSLDYRFLAAWLPEFFHAEQPALASDDVSINYVTSAFRLSLRYSF